MWDPKSGQGRQMLALVLFHQFDLHQCKKYYAKSVEYSFSLMFLIKVLIQENTKLQYNSILLHWITNWSTHCYGDAFDRQPTWCGLRMWTRQGVISSVRQDQMNDTGRSADTANKINYHFQWLQLIALSGQWGKNKNRVFKHFLRQLKITILKPKSKGMTFYSHWGSNLQTVQCEGWWMHWQYSCEWYNSNSGYCTWQAEASVAHLSSVEEFSLICLVLNHVNL